MMDRPLLELWRQAPEYRDIIDDIAHARPGRVFGLDGAQRAYLLAALGHGLGRPLVVLVARQDDAEGLGEDLGFWTDPATVDIVPAREVVPYEVYARSADIEGRRLSALSRLTSGNPGVLVVPVAALAGRLPPPEAFGQAAVRVRAGSDLEFNGLVRRLQAGGYESVDMVDAPGQFSRRGGIVDVYPLDQDSPLRLEFFGDTVDSIRRFDPGTQRSQADLAEAAIPPVCELVLPASAAARAPGLKLLSRELTRMAARLRREGESAAASRLVDRVGEHIERLESGESGGGGLEWYAPYFYSRMARLTDYLPDNAVVAVVEPGRIGEATAGVTREIEERAQAWLQQGNLLPRQVEGLYADAAAAVEALTDRQAVSFALFPTGGAGPGSVHHLSARPTTPFHGRSDLLIGEVGRLRRERFAVLIVCGTTQRAQAVAEGLRREEIPAAVVRPDRWEPNPGAVAVACGSLSAGFELGAVGLCCLTEGEVLGRRAPTRPRTEPGRPSPAYEDFKVGDYVVHGQHGIGRYLGIRTLEVEGVQRDYLFIRYSGEDRLYVPTDQIGEIQKYVGSEGHEPRLNRLGTAEWSRTKRRVRQSVREMASELLQLYAAREAMRGHDFPPDTPWQREFEAAFPFEETPDQLRAVEEIKRDMERSRPMDRLLCGDVGYGKTEVALRAAFKAVMDGTQVAFLAPTTILVHQHFLTFKDRFDAFPVKIEMLSRFRSAAQQADIARRLERGEIDIVVGTHRLLGADVRFKRLGLVIIDEEHRFGVAHKERLKHLRRTVDVLTMTATPIPRTLHMALAGLRDMSVIETPPENRYPVQTYVVEHDPNLVREAIGRERARDGQVYYVYNRVETINSALARLQRLVPGGKVAVAHGQMREDQLERVMLDFLEGRCDILLCTTIIESGLDIARVNTLVVEDSDRLGLAQLYQLRGRVGRSNQLAYAYFTYRRDKVLSEAAEKRLQAIREFTAFGSGFRIALRDLEIRGAGNILGPEQHGFVVAVGFNLYCRLLDQAVREMKGDQTPEEKAAQVVIDMAVDAFIPTNYVGGTRHKVALYKRIAEAGDVAEVDRLTEEMRDRFGVPPAPVQSLLRVARLRVRAAALGITAIAHKDDRLSIKFGHPERVDAARLVQWVGDHPGYTRVHAGETPTVVLRLIRKDAATALEYAESAVQQWRQGEDGE